MIWTMAATRPENGPLEKKATRPTSTDLQLLAVTSADILLVSLLPSIREVREQRRLP